MQDTQHYLAAQAKIKLRAQIGVITSVRITHRRDKIVVSLKLLPSRAFPVDGRGADLIEER